MILATTPYIVFWVGVTKSSLVDKLWRIGGHN